MATFLFKDIICGPIISRRMGVSLGVNLLPTNGKLCNFNCVYCECGWTEKSIGTKLRFNPKNEVLTQLEVFLKNRKERAEKLDVITFAGNGEPTMHPNFSEIIDQTIKLRDTYFPNVKIAVLTNATMIIKKEVREALEKVDRAMLKIDAVLPQKISAINDPYKEYSLNDVIKAIKQFNGEIIIQTMFLRGENNGVSVDNTSDSDISAWLEVLKDINPTLVVIYSLDRDTPSDTLIKVPFEELEKIGKKVEEIGIECSVTK